MPNEESGHYTVAVRFKREAGAEGIQLPSYQTPGSAGMDVRANEDRVLNIGETALVSTGFSIAVPRGFEAQMRPRSGLAIKHGITLLNTPGTVDSDYRGEVKIILSNFGTEAFTIRRGDRIAQMVIAKVERAEIVEVASLENTERGGGGFGHTGQQ